MYSPKVDPTLKYGTKGRTLPGDGNIIQPRTEEHYREKAAPNPEPTPKVNNEAWHPDAEYRITKWIRSGNSFRLEFENKYGEEVEPVDGVLGEIVNLPMPIQFTIPDWLEIMHVHIDSTYRIFPDGHKELLKKVKKNGNEFRVAYPRYKVLLEEGAGFTLWMK
ncbi:MAG: hypothetical protein IJR63_08080 [Synergistaceae bacterium]|nr:hypothetical protein [Synergistaceae bacterium]